MGEPEERPHKQQRRLGAMCYLGCDGLPPGTSGGIAIALGNPNPDGSEEEVVSFLRWDWLRASPMKWREKFCNLLWRELDGQHALLDGTDYDDFHEAFHQLIFTEAGEGDLLELRERAAWLARGGRGTCEDKCARGAALYPPLAHPLRLPTTRTVRSHLCMSSSSSSVWSAVLSLLASQRSARRVPHARVDRRPRPRRLRARLRGPGRGRTRTRRRGGGQRRGRDPRA